MRARLPRIVSGCERCKSLHARAQFARGDAAGRRKRLRAHSDDDLTARYVAEAKAAKEYAADQEGIYLAHHAEAHALPAVVLPRTDNDRAPSHRKPPLPPAADLAVRLRAGETLDDIAAEYQRTAGTLAPRLNRAGFSINGERRKTRDDDGLPAPIFEWAYPEWADQALCAQIGGDGWFPTTGTPGVPADNALTVAEAKAVYGRCPVRTPCLQWALDHHERFGIWGGVSERDRRKLEREAS